MFSIRCCVLFFLLLTFLHRSGAQSADTSLAAKIKRFAQTEIGADISKLSDGDRKALRKLVDASRLMDRLYLFQAWGGNLQLHDKLRVDSSELGKQRYHYFLINMGPWSKLDNDTPFIARVPAKPPGANYYPPSLTKEEFNKWLETQTDSIQQLATGFYHTIRRRIDILPKAVPYSLEYRNALEPAAQLLREAAELTGNASLKNFLTKRADAFLSNQYYESEVAWMDLDSPLEVTIGPYEVYMDELFNYKAAFEAYLCLRNDEETKKLEKFSSYLQDIENSLPIDAKYRNPKLGALAPIRVVDELFTGGEARAGVQTAAYNLPNDERVTKEKGSKRVMLKNVQEAKFNKILKPIASVAVDSEQQSLISFEPFFTHILAHELMHGLGPHTITVNGKETTVRQEMKVLSSALEEAKADISGLFALQFLIDKGVVEKSMEQQMYVTYLAGVFRSVRFGTNDAHGKGMALQFNYLTNEGAFGWNETNETFKVNFDRMKSAVTKLTAEIMTIQAQGDYEEAKALIEKFGVIRPQMQRILDKLTNVPVDIEPVFTIEKQLKE